MGDVLTFNRAKKPSPPAEPKVCANCQFLKRRWMEWECDALGGYLATSAWRQCEGFYWSRKLGFISRIKRFFS